MITNTLRSMGYKESRNDDLINKEFRLVTMSKDYNAEMSTMGYNVFSTSAVFELFISHKNTDDNTMENIVDNIGVDVDHFTNIDISYDNQENGKLYTINVSKEIN